MGKNKLAKLKLHYPILIIAVVLLLLIGGKWYYSVLRPTLPTSYVANCNITTEGCMFNQTAKIQLIGVGNNKTPFKVRIEYLPEQTQQVSVSFKMRDMDMGFNRFDLNRLGQGTWEINSVYLPLCRNERHDWIIEWTIDSQIWTADFQTKP